MICYVAWKLQCVFHDTTIDDKAKLFDLLQKVANWC